MSFRIYHINWLEVVIAPAIDLLYSTPTDTELIRRDTNERTSVANIHSKVNGIFSQIQSENQQFANLRFDIEYNRNYEHTKRIFEKCGFCHIENCFIKERNQLRTNSSPDMILHQRGSNEDNQVVIEFKKTSNVRIQERDLDKAKLIYFTCQQSFLDRDDEDYKYQIGFFIDLDEDRYSLNTYQDTTYDDPRVRYGGRWL
jgi:hypothetical protein